MSTHAIAETQAIAPPTRRFRSPFQILARMRRDPLDFFFELQRDHGDLVRLVGPGMRGYLVLRPEHVRHILQDNPRGYWKGRVFQRLTRFAGNGILFSEGDFWLRQRRMAAPAFHRAAVERLGDDMAARADALADRWLAERRDEPFDVAPEMAGLALEIVSRALFGADVDDWKETFTTNINYGMEYANYLVNSLTPLPMWVPTRRNRGMRQRMAELDGFLRDMVERRQREPSANGDLLSMLLEARDEDTQEGMTERQLLDECITFISAGHETTGMALSWCWAVLAQHPEVEARLHAELDPVLGDRLPGVADLPQLGYTRRVVEETLRLYPPAWVTGRESLGPDEIDGFRIEPKSFLFLSPYVTHRHPEFWDDPETFDPDRFLPERSEGRPRYAYYPFGGGRRLCIGREFALVELQLVLATLARRLRLELAPGHEPSPDPIFTLRPKGGMWMRRAPRS